MKILFIVNNLGIGGAEKMVVFVAEELAKRGHICNIINLNINNTFEKIPTVLKVYDANIKYTGTLHTNYQWVKYAYRISKIESPDILVGFAGLSNFCAATVGKLLKIPSVVCERSDPFYAYKSCPLSKKLKLMIINRATGAVFQTKEASNFYSRKLRNHSAIIPNPIFVNEEVSPIDYRNLPKTIVSLGRYSNKQKRFDILLRGFAEFHQHHSEYVLNIYGKGPDEDYIKELIQSLGIGTCTNLHGKTDMPMTVMSKEGIFVITSDYEGISNSLLEAMAVGLPVISTDHSPGGARFLIEDHKNGLLIPMGDCHALACALTEYADNPMLRSECGINAQEVLKRFTPRKCIDSWESYLKSIVN